MTENKRFNLVGGYVYDKDKCISHFEDVKHRDEIIDLLNELHEERNYFERKKCEYWNKFNLAHLDNINLRKENEQLKKDVEYWKQVASQYSNELNVFEHCKKYKTECKDIYWSSD